MGAVYTIPITSQAAVAAMDFFSIKAPAGKSLKLHALYIGQYSDSGSAEIEIIRWRVRRGQTTQGSGGSVPTPVPVNPSAAAMSSVAHTGDTTQASAGTIVTVHEGDPFEIHGGLQVTWTPETRPEASAGTCITIELEAAPNDSLTFSGTAYVEECG